LQSFREGKLISLTEIINDADLAEKQENATLAREAERVFGRIDSGEEKTISSKNLQQNPWN
jgi:hypothetical protein